MFATRKTWYLNTQNTQTLSQNIEEKEVQGEEVSFPKDSSIYEKDQNKNNLQSLPNIQEELTPHERIQSEVLIIHNRVESSPFFGFQKLAKSQNQRS